MGERAIQAQNLPGKGHEGVKVPGGLRKHQGHTGVEGQGRWFWDSRSGQGFTFKKDLEFGLSNVFFKWGYSHCHCTTCVCVWGGSLKTLIC